MRSPCSRTIPVSGPAPCACQLLTHLSAKQHEITKILSSLSCASLSAGTTKTSTLKHLLRTPPLCQDITLTIRMAVSSHVRSHSEKAQATQLFHASLWAVVIGVWIYAPAALSKEDNKRRPGRYILLQEEEKRVFGTERVKSSLTDGNAFKTLLGNKKWQEVIPRGERLLHAVITAKPPGCFSVRKLRLDDVVMFADG